MEKSQSVMASKRRRPRKQPETHWLPWAIALAVIIAIAVFIAVYPIQVR